MKVYSVRKNKAGEIVPGSKTGITSKDELVASNGNVLVFVDDASDEDIKKLTSLGFSLVPTQKDGLSLLIASEPDFVW